MLLLYKPSLQGCPLDGGSAVRLGPRWTGQAHATKLRKRVHNLLAGGVSN